MTNGIEALTLDWYGTLATHRRKVGRGAMFSQYLAWHGLLSTPWNRQSLYDAFEYYGNAYKPQSPEEEKRIFWIEFTRRLFESLQVRGGSANQIELHAAAVGGLLGSGCFALYDDVRIVLHRLKQRGLQLAVVSNWHRGLDSFCCELGLSDTFETVISSSDAGIEKPDSRIFHEAAYRLRVRPEGIVHVGDLVEQDYAGAVAAGLKAILIDRDNVHANHPDRIQNLHELEKRLHPLK